MSLLVVRVGERRFAVDLDAVQEIVERTTVTLLPRLPKASPGVVDAKGLAVPVFDVGTFAGDAPRHDHRSMVLATAGTRPVALLVDDVDGIEEPGAVAESVTRIDLAAMLEGLA